MVMAKTKTKRDEGEYDCAHGEVEYEDDAREGDSEEDASSCNHTSLTTLPTHSTHFCDHPSSTCSIIIIRHHLPLPCFIMIFGVILVFVFVLIIMIFRVIINLTFIIFSSSSAPSFSDTTSHP